MALVHKDRVQETSTTTGTGTYTLLGAVAGFQSFSAIGNANTCYYCATDGTDWEVGTGTYTSAGTTLARTAILASSNAGSAVNWAAGTRTIFCDLPASKFKGIGEVVAAADLPAATTSAQGAVQLADQAAQEARTAGRAVTSDVQQYHLSAAKAWVAYTDSGTPSIGGSFNVSSITDNGVGDHTINFTTAFSSTNYASAAMGRIDTTGGGNYSLIGIHRSSGALAVGSIRLVSNGTSFTAADYTWKTAVFYGDQ